MFKHTTVWSEWTVQEILICIEQAVTKLLCTSYLPNKV